MKEKEIVKIAVDKKIFSALRKRKKMDRYIESLMQQETLKDRFRHLLDKLTTGYDLGGFKREDVYDRT